MEHESDGDDNYNWCTWNNPQRIGTGTGRLRNQRTSEDHPDYSIIKIDQKTKKSPGDLRRLAVTQIPVENPSAGVKNSQKSKIITICKQLHDFK